jgi:hypothetical protein
MSNPAELTYRERFGLAATLQSAVLRRLRRWFGLRVYGIYARRLKSNPGPDAVVPGFRARLFEQREAEVLLAHAKSPDLQLSERFVRHALDKGDVCLAILADDEIISYTWCAFTPTHDDDGVFVRFDSTDRYAYNTFTLREYRGRHLLRYFTPIRDRYCIDVRGRPRSISFIDLDNRSSIRASLSIGSRRIGAAGYLKWGRVFWPFTTAGARANNFHFFMPRGSRRISGGG